MTETRFKTMAATTCAASAPAATGASIRMRSATTVTTSTRTRPQRVRGGSLRGTPWCEPTFKPAPGYEACDDGNQVDDDVCNNQCRFNDCEPTVRTFEHTWSRASSCPNARSLRLEVWGAQGGPTEICGGRTDNDGGAGGYAVTWRSHLAIRCTFSWVVRAFAVAEGTNGGGDGGRYGAGGGGGSDVRAGGQGLGDRVLVAGGGGGGNTGCPNRGTGGAGGGENGANGIVNAGNRQAPTGGTQNAGGRAGTRAASPVD